MKVLIDPPGEKKNGFRQNAASTLNIEKNEPDSGGIRV